MGPPQEVCRVKFCFTTVAITKISQETKVNKI